MLILSERDLRSVLTMKDVIEVVEEGFRAFERGDARAPERLLLSIPEHKGVMLEMPACSVQSGGTESRRGALGTKLVTVFDENPERGLDTIQSVYLLLDNETGQPMALMEGRFITAIRTAATSAVATRHMAGSGPQRLALFGAGVQAHFHLDAMIEVAEVESVAVVSRTDAKGRALTDRVESQYSHPCRLMSPEEAAAWATLICACTSAGTPLFDGNLLGPGVHINAIGAFSPTTRELDTATVRRARVIVDAQSAAGREAGDILIPIAEGAVSADYVKGTLGEVVSGKVAGRQSADEITVFKSCGLAIEDLVTAQLAYDKARALGIGTEVSLSS